MTWFWKYGVLTEGIPEGREEAVADACAGVLSFDDPIIGPGTYEANGGDALSNATEPRDCALDLVRAIWDAAGVQLQVEVLFLSYEHCDDDGKPLDDEPAYEFKFGPESADEILGRAVGRP